MPKLTDDQVDGLIKALGTCLSVCAELPDMWASEADMFEGMRLAAEQAKQALLAAGIDPSDYLPPELRETEDAEEE